MANAELTRTSPLSAVLVVVALGSLGTGAITNGIFFLAKSAYGFDDRLNLMLGLVLGATYIVGALGVGPALRRAVGRTDWLSTRAMLAGILLIIAFSAALPAIASSIPSLAGPWSLWAAVLIFAPSTGALWPIVESYLSGGRRGKPLIHAIGAFNIVWSIAVLFSMLMMAPLIKSHPLLMLGLVGGAHVPAAFMLRFFEPEPAQTHPDAWPDEPHPSSFNTLLAVFRVLLPLSYVLMSVLSPLMPGIFERLEIEIVFQPILVSVWMAARVIAFIALERWHGWHGLWLVPIGSTLLLGAGFAAVVLAPGLGSMGLPILIAGLFAFGIGMAGIYVGALYYVMEVGHGGVDAGGSHEAIIGIGYTLGPLCGLAAGGLTGWTDPGSRDTMVLVLIGVISLTGIGIGVPMALRKSPEGQEQSPDA